MKGLVSVSSFLFYLLSILWFLPFYSIYSLVSTVILGSCSPLTAISSMLPVDSGWSGWGRCNMQPGDPKQWGRYMMCGAETLLHSIQLLVAHKLDSPTIGYGEIRLFVSSAGTLSLCKEYSNMHLSNKKEHDLFHQKVMGHSPKNQGLLIYQKYAINNRL